MSFYPDSPPFDADAVDALPFYGRQVGFIIEDDDPDPNTIRKLLLSTREGAWKVAGQPVGPNAQHECEMAVAYQQVDGGDLRELQGPEAAARYSR